MILIYKDAKFACDTKLGYKDLDRDIIQPDLNKLFDWSSILELGVILNKGKVMYVGFHNKILFTL